MTDHSEFDDHTDDVHDGDFDPVVAERFRVLERVTPPGATLKRMAVAPTGRRAFGPDWSGPRTRFLTAVAACVGLLAVGAIAIVAANAGDETGDVDVAGEAAEVDVAVTAGGTAGGVAADSSAPLVVEGDPATSTTVHSTATTVADDANSGDTDEADVAVGEAQEPPETTDLVTTTTEKETTPPTEEPPPDDGGESGSDKISIRGVVTEVFTDCSSRLVLNEAGEVVQGGPVTCDGGSYITVDGTRIFTSSGFTSADLAYDKHPVNLKPGQEVAVTAAPIGGAGGPLGLACDTCRVRVIG